MPGDASATAIRAAAAVMVLADGREAELSQLSLVAGESSTAALRAQLCEGERGSRVRALSALLTSLALELSDWGLR